jgi:hypothetical protein
MRAIDHDRGGAGLGLPILVALTGALLERSTRGGIIVVGALNLGGSIETVPNAVAVAEAALEKQAATLLLPVNVRRQLNDLPDDVWTKLNIEFYSDAGDAVFKAMMEYALRVEGVPMSRPAIERKISGAESETLELKKSTGQLTRVGRDALRRPQRRRRQRDHRRHCWREDRRTGGFGQDAARNRCDARPCGRRGSSPGDQAASGPASEPLSKVASFAGIRG